MSDPLRVTSHLDTARSLADEVTPGTANPDDVRRFQEGVNPNATRELALDMTQLTLDVVGIFEPTPFADGTNTAISLGRGDWLGAGLSALGMIPYVGDLAKAGKLPRLVETAAKAVDLVKANPQLAGQFEGAFKQLDNLLKNVDPNDLPGVIREPIANLKTKVDEFFATTGRNSSEVTDPLRQTDGTAPSTQGTASEVLGSLNAVTRNRVNHYAELVNSNQPWTWREIDSSISRQDRKLIKQYAEEAGLIPRIPVDPATRFADFDSVTIREATLPENLWNATDRQQFEYLDNLIGGRPEGTTWHHHQDSGRMQLVPFGVHNITNHKGGRTTWAMGNR